VIFKLESNTNTKGLLPVLGVLHLGTLCKCPEWTVEGNLLQAVPNENRSTRLFASLHSKHINQDIAMQCKHSMIQGKMILFLCLVVFDVDL